MTLNPELLRVLACPLCRSSLDVVDDGQALACSRCGVVYPIREEIPVMLPEEAVPLPEWANGKKEPLPASTKQS